MIRIKLTINGYEVEITAHGEGSSDTASTMVLLDSIANACNGASRRMKEHGYEKLSNMYENIAADIFSALENAGMYD